MVHFKFGKAIRKDAAMEVCLMAFVAEIESEAGKAKPEDIRLQTMRKIASFATTTFGVTLADLPESLQNKIDDFGAPQKILVILISFE